jgi:CubicO group peptidase (beta-lactamase class C family)
MMLKSTHILAAAVTSVVLLGCSNPASPVADTYVPSPGPDWQRLSPEAAGMDATKLAAAIAFASSNETDFPADFSAQRRIFGRPLGPVPTSRAATNGIVLRHGYIVAEWGDTAAVDPVYSEAKSFVSTLTGLAANDGLIDIHDPVKKTATDGYDTPHNAKVTWQMHLRQTSEWEGTMWGKSHDFIGEEEFGEGRRKPRAFNEPGTYWEYNDVRINRLALSLAQVYGKALPEVLADRIMKPIGASSSWHYYGYANSQTTIAGKTVESVSGGTRWGGGLWISTRDQARFGLLMLRNGRWAEQQLVPAAWIREATTPGVLGPDYGYLWWLNSTGKLYPSAPRTVYAARGAGSNTLVVDPEHDLVVVWRWHSTPAMDGFLQRVIAAIN